jgi:hypothetical protein
MAKKAAVPTITKKKFDAIESQLRDALKKWWEDEAQCFDAAIAGTAAVWRGMPEIDSKAVVKASPVMRRFIGGDLDPKMIRKGGYASFDDLAADLLPKLRAACPSTLPVRPTAPEASDEATVESINVRRR